MRLSCEKSIKLAKAINPPLVVIPLYDFICNSTAKPNGLFKKIKEAEGIHKYFDYNGLVILSTIMRDDLIKKFILPEQYEEIINGLCPDYYFTPDGETYEKRENKSLREIIRLISITPQIIKLCQNSKPIGLVKGCNRSQILFHKNFLNKLGIKIFAFHTGDFFKNGDKNMIQRAKLYCSLIKEKDNFLILYGLGAPSRMLEFSFSDMFITYNHFVNAKHKKIFINKKKIKLFKDSLQKDFVYRAALYNFKELSKYVSDLKYQTKLIGGKHKWVGDKQDQKLQPIIKSQKVQN